MSAFIAAPFAEVAPHLEATGYQPVPIKPRFKAPMLDDWQAGHPVEHYLPHRHPVTGKVTDCASWGTGLLTASCPAIDIDIRDRELVRVLIELADEMIGGSPFRIGQRPKVLLPFCAEMPFEKLASRWFALPGDDWRSPGYKPNRAEILAGGQQFVSYARHPDTRRLYRWGRGEPMQTYRIDLPELTADLAARFVAVVEDVLLAAGAIPVRQRDQLWQPDLGEPDPQPARSSSNGAADYSAAWRAWQPETLAKAIDKAASRLNSGGYVCKCPAHNGEGNRSLSITTGNDGRVLLHCFGGCEFSEIVKAIGERIPT